MSKKAGIVISILSIIAVVISVAALIICLKPAETDAKKTDVQYVLYLGTNDKDSNLPVFTPDEAKKKAEDILIDHFGGYTIQEASGGWVDGDTEYQEYTLVIYLSDTDLESVHSAADEMIVEVEIMELQNKYDSIDINPETRYSAIQALNCEFLFSYPIKKYPPSFKSSIMGTGASTFFNISLRTMSLSFSYFKLK